MNHVVIVAAGRGSRMGLDINKVFCRVDGLSVLARTVRAFATCPACDGRIVVVAAASEVEQARMLLAGDGVLDSVYAVVPGGEDRQASVLCGLSALDTREGIVLISDGARPFVSREVIASSISSAQQQGTGVAAVMLKDTVKRVDTRGIVVETPERDTLRAVQTPQTFSLPLILRAHAWALKNGIRATDDAALVERMGHEVVLTTGDTENIKITTPEDLLLAQRLAARNSNKKEGNTLRAGHGYDVHRLVPDRELIICGVHIPYELGLLGHSDADVAAHALTDALLGAAALGDIGRHFPDTDARYKGADSIALLRAAYDMVKARGYALENADITIIAQRPKLKDYIPAMRENIAKCLGVAEDQVNIKATTTEGLGFEGEGLGISTHAVCMIKAA